ncbi:uncharacterized protein LACBIDRAFT_335304 [Laccaria bicolor S238N-H82]|uniref:Predicted protein n=1 Tax=Laccaria bicolor (strain S238N-H82 / ATCC MYA-4686) TaxID=486041 RepID=B0E1Y6_LACBS|nr:uncharacterized protein LACBIDRAFT_335304 [Laccaria bicolor S238N-H82]EDQ99137.1 predicted protein [Laccaria bicolor S238N-H82]|eukprot:XP_001890200.1 predicted protein [Laccaria bicolor S238N-H82]
MSLWWWVFEDGGGAMSLAVVVTIRWWCVMAVVGSCCIIVVVAVVNVVGGREWRWGRGWLVPLRNIEDFEEPNPWTSKKPLAWDMDYIKVGYLLVPDRRAQAHLRYWSACLRDTSMMTKILFKAIMQGIAFTISIKVKDFGKFKPEEVSDMDWVVGKPTCIMESPFVYTAPGALRAYYMSQVNNIIWQLHTRILIGLGSPEAWLGRKWGGLELVAQFMEGPSPDVYLHRHGYINLDNEHPMFLYMDEMSSHEIDVLFGCIHSDSNKDPSLYPSRDILDEGCFFWTGEWDSHMEDMFNNLTKDILQGLLGQSPMSDFTTCRLPKAPNALFLTPVTVPCTGEGMPMATNPPHSLAWKRRLGTCLYAHFFFQVPDHNAIGTA